LRVAMSSERKFSPESSTGFPNQQRYSRDIT
jgi:hypothetical protein